MAFPQTPLDTRVELLVDGVWSDVTADVYTTEKITITRGRADEAAHVDPGSCALTFNNRLGKYSPLNPRSPLYGKIGRNTPLRVSVPGPVSYLSLDGTPSPASTPDVASLDITADLDLRWEGEADWNTSSAQILIGKWDNTPGNRSYHLRLEDGRLILFVTTNGTTGFSTRSTLPALPRHAAVRATLDADNGAGTFLMRTYWAPSLDGPWTQFGVDGTIPGSGPITIYTSTAPLVIGPVQDDSTPPRTPVTGRCYRAQVRSGIDGAIVANPDFTAQAAGTTAFTDSAGRPWTLAANARITNRRIRFVGEVSSWPSRWDVSGNDVRVPVEASGLLRRYGQGAKALDSTLRRRVPSGNPRAYWPMEDGSTTTQASSPIPGVHPLTVTGMSFASVDTLPGSSALPALQQNATLAGNVPGARSGGWHAEMVYKLDKLPATEQTMLSVRLRPGAGGVTQVLARVSTGGIRVQCLDVDGNIITFFVYTDPAAIAAFTGVWNRLQIYCYASNPQTYVTVRWRDVITDFWYEARTVFTGTPGAITALRGAWGSDFQGMSIGHLAAFDVGGATDSQPGVTVYEGADDGFLGETAGVRMRRLAAEENMALTVSGNLQGEEQVGPQRLDTALNLIEEASDVDGGLFLEDRDISRLLYRDRNTLYNQAPALDLDYTQDGHIAPPLEPVDDDQKVRNDRTVTRDGGSSARAVLNTGPLSVQAPPNGVGIYDDSVTLNLYQDSQTEPQAFWRLHLGTVDEARYPVVNLDLAAAPALIDQVTAMDCGDRIRIANPPAWLPPGPIDLLVQGYQEVLTHPNGWDLQLNCTPASPWTVAEAAIVEDFEDTVYAVPYTNGGDAPWARSQVHYNTGAWSMKSGAISNNQTSDITFNLPLGATQLSFWYFTNSEQSGPGFEGDRLLVLVDGVQALRAQGYTYWTQAAINTTGARQVTFRYAKDNSGAGGEDAVWIDDLTFSRGPIPRADTDGSQLAADATAADTALAVTTTAGLPWITSAAYPSEFPFDVQVGGEVVTVRAIGPVGDAFGRTVANGWGTADSGQAWTSSGGAVADYSVASGVGRHVHPSLNVNHYSVLASTWRDVDVQVTMSADRVAAGDSLYGFLFARYGGTSSQYFARWQLNSDGRVFLTVRKRTAAAETLLSPVITAATTHAAGDRWTVRLRVTGSTIQAKTWKTGTAEPDWQSTVTDTEITGAGQIGVRSLVGTAYTGVLPVTFTFDDLVVNGVQQFTVTRAVNGVTKPQAAGTPVSLAHPATVAL